MDCWHFVALGLINEVLIGILHLLMRCNAEPPFEYNISTDAYTLCPSESCVTTPRMMNGPGKTT